MAVEGASITVARRGGDAANIDSDALPFKVEELPIEADREIGLMYAAFGPAGAAGAARKGGAIVSMVLDEERLCLYTLGARGFICTYDLAPLPGGGNSSPGGPPPGDRDGPAAVAGTAAAQDRPLLPRARPGLVRRPGGRGP